MFYKRYEIDAEVTAFEAQDCARENSLELERIKDDVERLLIITEALWSMVRENHDYDDEELIRRVSEIDARDGRLDGRVSHRPPADCPKCARPLMRDRSCCIYCGTETPVELFAR